MKKLLIVIALLLTVSNFNTGSTEDKDNTLQSAYDPIEVIW